MTILSGIMLLIKSVTASAAEPLDFSLWLTPVICILVCMRKYFIFAHVFLDSI